MRVLIGAAVALLVLTWRCCPSVAFLLGFAAVTYSISRTCSTEPRTWRATSGTLTTPTAMMTVVTLRSLSTAAIAMASTMLGNASITSTVLMIALSVKPPA